MAAFLFDWGLCMLGPRGLLLCLVVQALAITWLAAAQELYMYEAHPHSLGTLMITDDTGEVEAIGRSLYGLTTLGAELGHVLLVANHTYALGAARTLQICNTNTAFVHRVRQLWKIGRHPRVRT